MYSSWKMSDNEIEAVLPEIDVLTVFLWPRFLSAERIARMKRLRFLQTVLVGVNHIPFSTLGPDVVVASNSGAYSVEVGEHAWALLLVAAKRISEFYPRIKGGAKSLREFSGEAASIVTLEGKTMGIVGYGGIGRAVAVYARTFGMKRMAFDVVGTEAKGVKLVTGREGLESLLCQSDAVLLSLPLTNSTYRLIGKSELSLMKENAILVNIARGDLVDQEALYTCLKARPNFRYATDAWWLKEGQETLETGHPLVGLPNFVGTPHISGPSAAASGRPWRLAVENVLKYVRGESVKHVIDRSEYTKVQSRQSHATNVPD